jgi:tetrahydrodipicolinate N-succinyltransferase
VAIAGSSTIEPYCFLGTNCTLRNGIKIAKDCVIGAGCVILEDTKEKEVFVTRSTAIPNFNRDLLKDI